MSLTISILIILSLISFKLIDYMIHIRCVRQKLQKLTRKHMDAVKGYLCAQDASYQEDLYAEVSALTALLSSLPHLGTEPSKLFGTDYLALLPLFAPIVDHMFYAWS